MRKGMKQVLAMVMSIALAVGGVSYTAKSTKEVKAADDYQYVWSDEFNGLELDTSIWSYEIGNGNWGWGNGEVEYYTDRKENVEVKDGYLQIHALKDDTYKGFKYTSGRIISKGKKYFKYGKMEARIKVENGNQDGVWPAYWMMGQNIDKYGWPKCGEIDIMEHANSNNFVGGCLHWNTTGLDGEYNPGDYGSGFKGAEKAFGYFSDNVNNGINGWHTYGLIWDENHMEWQLDGVTYLNQKITDNNAYCFQQNQFFLFNLAIGGTQTGFTGGKTANENTYQTATMYVDWLRVYQKPKDIPTKYEGPTITVTQDAVKDYTGTWNSFFGNTPDWVVAAGNIETGNTPEEGFTAKITSVGKIVNDSVWGVQSNLENIKYYPGNTYKYKCTITSDKDKKIFVKVADKYEETMGGSIVDLKAGVPYDFETDVAIPEDYTGSVSLKFGMGKTDGDSIADNSAVTINVKDISFVTTATIPDPSYQVESTTPTPETESTTKDEATAKTPETTVKDETTTDKAVNSTTNESSTVKVAKTKIKKASKKKTSKKAKISLKKIKEANGYKVQISTSKKFKKTKKVKVITKYTKKATFTFKSSKIKNKNKLYVRARAYKIVNGKKKYGSWSKTKKMTIKK